MQKIVIRLAHEDIWARAHILWPRTIFEKNVVTKPMFWLLFSYRERFAPRQVTPRRGFAFRAIAVTRCSRSGRADLRIWTMEAE